MIAVSPSLNAALMIAFLAKLDAASGGVGAGYYQFFGGVRPAAGAAAASSAVCTVTLALPSGVINPTTGAFEFVPTPTGGANGQITTATPMTWARGFDGAGNWVHDCDVRMAGSPDLGQEIVLSVATTNIGAFVRLSGGFTV